ncbi:hypothetical protein [Wolbachia endosymbiont of Aedes albopictus]|uniref:hypothetical protein n=1 Tax=Wolbachia endosymbiont of Aedes albopictus TaxID=167957 RepID=UPI000BBC8E97|nr:hypothetical protein [Wolbachia endosymbiont of Aedes albopictus]UVW83963.1 hypothetical protein NHG98_00330 [Wolbachia endosymbiont of Aedes albopictus]
MKEHVQSLRSYLRKEKKFAFNILDCAARRAAFLFKTLFDKLCEDEYKDYGVHLKGKSTPDAQNTLKRLYSNNKESSNNLSTEDSNKDSLSPVQKRKRAEASQLYSQNIVPKETESLTRLENGEQPSTSLQSSTMDALPELNFSLVSPSSEEMTVSSSLKSNENIPDNLECELPFQLEQNFQINEEQPSTNLQLSRFDRSGDLKRYI